MNLVTKISIVTATTFLLSACGSAVQPQQSVFTPIAIATPIKPAIQELHMTIQQGVTTKQEVFQVLGQPDSYVNSTWGVWLSYYSTYENKKRVIYLTYIEKDGTELSYIISSAQGQNSYASISLDKQNKVSGIQVY